MRKTSNYVQYVAKSVTMTDHRL